MPPSRIRLRHRHAFGRRRAARRIALLLLSGLPPSVAPEAPNFAQPAPSIATPASNPYAAYIAEASQRFSIPEHWIRAVLRTESAGDVRAVSTAGAMGLMQVMPDTWAGLRIRHRLGRDPFEPRDNILAGTAYLREMFDRYGNVAAMLAAYNAGPGRYDEYLETGRALPPETRAYVAALAPILGGETSPDTAPPPSDWREAPLFVTRPADTRTVAAPPSGVQSGDGRAAIPERGPVDAESETGSLFVARADDEGTP
ncbi:MULTISPECIES: lytic transglycosylase domain-containing protein [Alphaproteobacteria]|uniref:lytic transglycosylase domain-containing protein n=1 Tax=Alphaproteobacteria TaxID=28211 RepID=UPI003266087B